MTRRGWKTIALAAAVLALAEVRPSAAEHTADGDTAVAQPCAVETAARLRFLEEELESGRAHGQYWWRGFVGFYGIGTVVTSVQAATDKHAGDRAVDTVSAVKAAFGTARLLYSRPNAMYGSDDMRAVPLADADSCALRLRVGEATLERNAKEAERRYSWKQHAGVVGVNAAGAIVAGEAFDERKAAWISAGIGIAVGEAMTFLHPWEGRSSLSEYRRHFGGPPAVAAFQWELFAMPRGAGVRVRF